jgi:CheY-like chemotaxis protein
MSERVLILDDESLIADLLGEIFRILGFEPRVCYEPRAALAALAEQDFDLVVSDYRMPQMNGQRFYNALVALRPELAQRVIFLTGDAMSDDTQEFFRATGAPFLGKPFDLAKVERVARSVLDHSPLESGVSVA